MSPAYVPILAFLVSGNSSEAGDLRHSLEPYWRRRWLVLAIVIVLPLAMYFGSKQLSETYEASTTLQVRSSNFSSQAFTDQISVTTNSAEDVLILLNTSVVREAATEELGLPEGALPSGEVTGESLSASASSSGFITITAEGSTAEEAANTANAFGAAIVSTRTRESEREIRATITDAKQRLDQLPNGPNSLAARQTLQEDLQRLRGLLSSQQGNTQVIEPAPIPSAPVSPNPGRNAGLGLVLGLLIAAGLVPILDRINRKLREPEELSEFVGAQLLSQIPESAFPGKVPTPAARESFQTLRASLRYFNLDRALGSVIVTSPGHAEGKTTVATNLALTLARDGEDVVLIDADLRKPRVYERLGLEGSYGLESILVDNVPVDEAIETVYDGDASLRVIATNRPGGNPAALLSSRRMGELVAELTEQCDIVVIDTPPVLAVSDAVSLFQQSSGVVFVSKLHDTGAEAIQKASQVIRSARGEILGVVATGAKSGGLYGGYGDYGYGDSAEPAAKRPKPGSNGNGSSGGVFKPVTAAPGAESRPSSKEDDERSGSEPKPQADFL